MALVVALVALLVVPLVVVPLVEVLGLLVVKNQASAQLYYLVFENHFALKMDGDPCLLKNLLETQIVD